MIHRLYSDLTTAKAMQFKAGLNVVRFNAGLNGTSHASTRTGTGKTAIIELIHYVMGGPVNKSQTLTKEPLKTATFGVELDIRGTHITAQRSPSRDRFVQLTMNSTSARAVPLQPWKALLGDLVFGLPQHPPDDSMRYGPTFRSLFSYFARRHYFGGMTSPLRHTAIQQSWDYQVALSYLLGLDWTIPQRWQTLREREKTAKGVKLLVRQGILDFFGDTVALRSKLSTLDRRVADLGHGVKDLTVLADFRGMEDEIARVSSRIAVLLDDNSVDHRLVSELEASLAKEGQNNYENVKRMFAEAGVVLPQAVGRRFDEVHQFHEAITKNRSSYLMAEIVAAHDRIRDRESVIRQFSTRKAELVTILGARGALDQFVQLQSELARVQAESEIVRQQLVVAEYLEGYTTEFERERGRLQARLEQDYQEQAAGLAEAVSTFDRLSTEVYGQAGALSMRFNSRSGPVIEVLEHGSHGATCMQILCFDLMLMQLCSRRGLGPGFLIHDSDLFSGVDERLVVRALATGAKQAQEYGFQYIVLFDAEDIPSGLDAVLPVEEYIVDVDVSGSGFFGVQF